MKSAYSLMRFITADNLQLIGCYVQTCAHIEHSMWAYYFNENPVGPDDQDEKNRILELRLNTQRLIEAIEKHIQNMDDEAEAEMVADVIKEVREGRQTRHHIIHGALQFDGESGGYVLHHHWKPDPRKKEYLNYCEPLPASHLRGAMDNADNILVRAQELYHRSIVRAKRRTQEE